MYGSDSPNRGSVVCPGVTMLAVRMAEHCYKPYSHKNMIWFCIVAVLVQWLYFGPFFAITAVFPPFSCFCNVIDIILFVIIFYFLIMLLFVLVAVAHITQLELEILLCKYSESISRRNK